MSMMQCSADWKRSAAPPFHSPTNQQMIDSYDHVVAVHVDYIMHFAIIRHYSAIVEQNVVLLPDPLLWRAHVDVSTRLKQWLQRWLKLRDGGRSQVCPIFCIMLLFSTNRVEVPCTYLCLPYYSRFQNGWPKWQMVCYSAGATDLLPNVSKVYSKSDGSMPVAFSEDLRWCIVWQYIYSTRRLIWPKLQLLCVSKRTVRRIVNLIFVTGHFASRASIGRLRTLIPLEETVHLMLYLRTQESIWIFCISKLPSYKMLKMNKLNSSDQKGMQTQIIQEWSHAILWAHNIKWVGSGIPHFFESCPIRYSMDESINCTHSKANEIRYLTRITYIFLKNSSNFWRRRTWISVWTRSDFLHNTARKNLDRNSTVIRVENGESKSPVKLSQFCYGFKDIHTYRKSSEGVKVTVKSSAAIYSGFTCTHNIHKRQRIEPESLMVYIQEQPSVCLYQILWLFITNIQDNR